MPGYPIAWTEKWDSFDPTAAGSPYTAEEIKSYLIQCQSRYAPRETPLKIKSIDFVTTKSLSTRRFWVWEVSLNEQNTQWLVVVGSGTSPFVAQKQNVDRWVYAETNDDGLSAEEFLNREIDKHPD